MKEMTFYRCGKNYTYSKINEKIFCFDKNKFVVGINENVKQYGDSLLEQFNALIDLAKAGSDTDNFSEVEIEEAKITFMKSYFYTNGFGK